MNAANEDLVSLFNDIFFKRVFIGHINIISDKYIIVYIFESKKTVLMKCICGFLKPDNGKIFLRGKRMQGEKSIIGNMGIIIEVPGFFEDETAKK